MRSEWSLWPRHGDGRGLHEIGDTLLYVNRGIGTEGGRAPPRVRFWSRPEITVYEIAPAARSRLEGRQGSQRVKP